MAKFLLTKETAKLYRLGIFIESEMSISPAIEFVKKNKWVTPDQFYSVVITYHPGSHKFYQEFMSHYITQGYDLEAIYFRNIRKITKSIQFLDVLTSYNYLAMNNLLLKWKELSIIFCRIPLDIIKGVHFNNLHAYSSDIIKMKNDFEENQKDDDYSLTTVFHQESCRTLKL